MLKIASRIGCALGFGLAMAMTPTIAAAKNVSLTIVSEFRQSWERNFNPFNSAHRLPTTMQFIYEPLIVFNELQGGKPVYRLAIDHRFSSDLKTLTFDLRKDVKWSDGTAFTADDVVYSLRLAARGGALDVRGLADDIDSIVKENAYTVSIQLNKVDTGIATRIVRAPIVPKHIFSMVKDIPNFTNPNPVGTGPFTQVPMFSWQVYIQCRNPHYYQNEKLKIDCLQSPIITSNEELLAAAIKGRLDWTSSFIPNIEEVLLSKNSSTRYWFPAAGSASFVMNFKSPNENNRKAFNNLSFRRAFSMAMDRKRMVEEAGSGYWVENNYPSGLGDQFKSWSDPLVRQKYGKFNTYNKAYAAKLLRDVGFKDIDNDGWLDNPDGSQFSFEILVPNGWSDHIKTVEIAIEGLKALGINAMIATPEFGQLVDQVKSGNYDAQFTNYFAGATPHLYYHSGFHSSQFDKNRFAGHHYADAMLDKLIDGFNRTNDEEVRLNIMHRIEERIGSQQITVPVISSNFNYQYDDVNFKGWFNEENPGGIPVIHPDIPERLLHVLSLEPVISDTVMN
ncbi:ABC transporter substrate-binding protein [Motilimonas sp. E26]|uniref:ABC transporter substrate-binding protein n=1 Tax=Motilimonas sp. E26 TaxID=2865674 RepID=UPI001E658B90|nr:ABC transporter substrate-binding protein [Motilimonas sp. E26]MCE0555410.1 ABC transporter substrate-binding protein [Motilimonas sp. E26]